MGSTTPTQRDPRWARVVARDRSADGQFWYSVATTGVYCRPSCASRTANARNVLLHDTLEQAKAAGFRPCKRCKPDGIPPYAARSLFVEEACRLIERSVESPSLAELANAVRLSPGYFHRLFKSETGLTPKAYAAAHRAGRVRTQYRAGGANEEIRFAVGQCMLGAILVASSTKGVVSISMGDDPDALVRELQDRFAAARLIGGDAAYEALVARVVGFVEAPALGLDLPLDVRGTAFQRRVWQALREIPAGGKVSYADIARKIGAPRSVRAVAGACASNTIAVAIPCHRVVRSDGGLSGYRWGIARKRALIERETSTG
jgi:AraC family transcriptional regulator of adaptative response/methylated-DNA-[protein]-cysteine methyltransferase